MLQNNDKYIDYILQSSSIEDLKYKLSNPRCHMCDLSELGQQVVLYRGSTQAKLMLIGEGPGAVEDQYGIPFCGPAGKLLDELAAPYFDTNKDAYLCNVVSCQPKMPIGSKKQNFKPQSEHCDACKPILMKQIELVQPRLILMIGRTSTEKLLNVKNPTMKFYVNKPQVRDFGYGKVVYVPTYHPAAILYSKGVIGWNSSINDSYDIADIYRSAILETFYRAANFLKKGI